MSPRATVKAFEQAVSNVNQSINLAVDRSINIMAQRALPGTPKADLGGRATPGLRPRVVLPNSPIRAEFQQDGRAWVVSGSTLFEIFEDGTFASRGTVTSDAFMASMASNGSAGNQLMIVSGGNGYILDLLTNSLAQISDGDFPDNVRMCLFIDGYFVVFVADSRHFQISALEDGTSWDALDFGERSIASDNIVSMVLLNRNVWFLGSKTSEPWYNSGDPLFPFAPASNTLIIHGAAAPFATAVLSDTIFSLGQDETGSAMVWRYEGYVPTRISTAAVEFAIAEAGAAPFNDFSLSVAWVYQEQGQSFFVLQCPTAETTWVFDTTTDLWHERARCNPDFDHLVRSPGNSHIYFGGKHLVGDRTSGAVYEQSLEIFTETII